MMCLRPQELHIFNLRPQDLKVFFELFKFNVKLKQDKQIETEGVVYI